MAENNKDVGITVEARMAVSYDKDGSPSCVLMQASLDFESEPDLDEIGNKIESAVRKWMENQGAENVKVAFLTEEEYAEMSGEGTIPLGKVSWED